MNPVLFFTPNQLAAGALIAASIYAFSYLFFFGFTYLKKVLWKSAVEDYRETVIAGDVEPLLLTCPCGQEVACRIRPSLTAASPTPLKIEGECPQCGKTVDAPFVPLPDIPAHTSAFLASFAILGFAAAKTPFVPSVIFAAGGYAIIMTWMKRRMEKRYLHDLWKTPESPEHAKLSTEGKT